jgi:peptidyl-prolyl cis-trans isomerase SurA
MEYNVSHILIAVPQDASQTQVDESAKRAQDIYDRATGTEDFGRLAVAYGDSQTALEGGSLGWRKALSCPPSLPKRSSSSRPAASASRSARPAAFTSSS